MERMGSTPFPSKDKPLTHRVSRDREAFWKAAESEATPKGGAGTPRAPEAGRLLRWSMVISHACLRNECMIMQLLRASAFPAALNLLQYWKHAISCCSSGGH